MGKKDYSPKKMLYTYKDIAFCQAWDKCEYGSNCLRAITPEVIKDADDKNEIIWEKRVFGCFKEKDSK